MKAYQLPERPASALERPAMAMNRIMAYAPSLVLLALLPSVAMAQSAGPRDYLNTPVNAAGIFLDYVNSSSETASESDLPLPNNEAVGRSGFVSLLYSFPLGSQYGGIAINGGAATVKVATPFGKLEASGLTDPSVTFHANIFGAPALTAEQFRSAIPQTYLSFHFTITAPLGSYDPNSAVNSGANRWAFTPLMNLDITPDKGVSWLDIYAGGRFFTSNNAFQGGTVLAQAPLGTISMHYSHNITKIIWAAVGVYYDAGGETFINGISQHDRASGFRPTAAISGRVGKVRLTLRYDSTASTPRAAPTNGLIALKLSAPLF
jgi:Putative MetA-pathway of phenol degradation